MTDEQAKTLGRRAVRLGVPWADGLADGLKRSNAFEENRIGCIESAYPGRDGLPDVERCGVCAHSWPDFRDPLTEAWLVAWAQLEVWQRSGEYFENLGIPLGDSWQIEIDGEVVVQGKTRAEAWILALERLGGS